MTDRNPDILSPSGAEVLTQIKSINHNHHNVSLCSFVLNCHHKQDAASIIINADQTLFGGILCDGVSESPNSGLFSNFIVDSVRNRLSALDLSKFITEFNNAYLEWLLNEIIQQFFSIYGSQLNINDFLPKSTFILYLTTLSPTNDLNFVHYFFYLGDGKIAVWNNQSAQPPSEYLLEYHNETGVLLNALMKDFSSYSKQYPISKMILSTPKKKNQIGYVLFTSDGLEPYYEEFLELLQQHPEIWEIIQDEDYKQFQILLLTEIFEDLKQIPNDDVSFIFIINK